MLNWALAFFVAAIAAAVFGFGAVASDFAAIALLLFWVFVALFAVTLIVSLFTRAGEGVGTGGPIALLVAVLCIGFLVYAWIDHGLSAESLGRSVDHGAARLSTDASDVINKVGDRAGHVFHQAGTDLRQDTANGLGRAQHAVEPHHPPAPTRTGTDHG